MTDGHENASQVHTFDSIQQLITARQEAGWLVSFLGADLSVAEQGVQLGADAKLVAAYVRGDGLRAAGPVVAAFVSRLVQSMDAGLTDSERAILRGELDD
jgi:hypothetical protein